MPAVPPATIRSHGAEGIPEAARLVEKVFHEEFDLPVGELLAREAEAARWDFDEGRDLLLTAETGGRLVGTLLVFHDAPAPAPTALFSWLAVDAAFRGRGIGRDLFAKGLETCRQRGLVRLRARSFSLSAAAPHLYWLHGFRVVELLPVVVAGRPRETLLFEKLLDAPAEG
ncbi:MAG TPA: GNAT family N-acetyltransferase [Thermoanaerobaculia bacterium]|nr:GNAT family N-acetyltransferase [Thermoanaerobaculia bacterium]